MSNEAKLDWAAVLGLVQKIAPAEGWAFTTDHLVEVGLSAKEAAKWLTKFVDWGYIRRGDFEATKVGVGGRPKRIYHMLKRGVEKDLSALGTSDVVRLLDAVRTLIDAGDEKAEAEATKILFSEYWAIVDEQKKRLEKRQAPKPT